ncbi:hypothetical protein [Tumebacillus lipolyticus]|uniref:Regulatory protein YycH-like domain-containing protein n=1 Tax=Tumebacillus lipolyticus TaxID=1280370 RepID=A0ABW4ZUR8_9BACL
MGRWLAAGGVLLIALIVFGFGVFSFETTGDHAQEVVVAADPGDRSGLVQEIAPSERVLGEQYPKLVGESKSYFGERKPEESLKAAWHLKSYEIRNVSDGGEERGEAAIRSSYFQGPSEIGMTDFPIKPDYSSSPEVPADVISAFFGTNVEVEFVHRYSVSVKAPHVGQFNTKVFPLYRVQEFEVWEDPLFGKPTKVGAGKVKLPAGIQVETWDLGV